MIFFPEGEGTVTRKSTRLSIGMGRVKATKEQKNKGDIQEWIDLVASLVRQMHNT